MHPAFSSAISVWNLNKISPRFPISGCSSMCKALDYRAWGGAACGFEQLVGSTGICTSK